MTEGGALQVGSPIHDKRELEAVLNAAEWPPSLHPEALRIAGCESGWDPHAIGSQGEVGLFQIHGVHAWRVPPQGDLRNPVVNAQVALEIWRAEGWEPWTCASALGDA